MIFFVDKQLCYRLLLITIATTNAAAAAATAAAAAAAAYTISNNFINKKSKRACLNIYMVWPNYGAQSLS